MLRKLELPAEDVVFLDDIGSNVVAAESMGIQSIKVKNIHMVILHCDYRGMSLDPLYCRRGPAGTVDTPLIRPC